MQYKIVDKKAPRFTKTEFQTKLNIKQLHQEFEEQTGIKMSKEVFQALYEETMHTVVEFAITERNGVVLPEQMGNIHLAFFKIKRPFYNYLYTRETGIKTAENIFGSDGLQGKICWDYKTVKYKPRDYRLYGFVACRDFKRLASNAFDKTAYIFRRYVYDTDRIIEKSKKKKLERNERNNQGGNQSAESAQQGS